MRSSPDYIPFKCSARDGLLLAGRKYGWQNKDDHPVVCLPGITRNASDFHDLALYLTSEEGGERRVVTIDFRGRGASEHDKDWKKYTLSTEAEDTIDILTSLNIHEAHVIGSSRGALVALMLATSRPGLLKSVIMNDMGPVIDATGLVRIWRTYETKNLPDTIEEAAILRERIGKASSAAFTKEDWLKEAHRLYEIRDGKMWLKFDRKLITSLRTINLDERLPDMWPEFAALGRIPSMVIRAENSDILSGETVDTMKVLHPKLQAELALGQSHAPILSVGGLDNKIAKFLQKHS